MEMHSRLEANTKYYNPETSIRPLISFTKMLNEYYKVNTLFLSYFFYLFGKGERKLSLCGSPLRCPQQPGLGQAEAGSSKLNPCFLCK